MTITINGSVIHIWQGIVEKNDYIELKAFPEFVFEDPFRVGLISIAPLVTEEWNNITVAETKFFDFSPI